MIIATSRLSKFLILLVGVCLIGTAFHVHQLHPDYELQKYNLEHHLSIDQPDCIACMNGLQSIPAGNGDTEPIFLELSLLVNRSDRSPVLNIVSDLNNKSPPLV